MVILIQGPDRVLSDRADSDDTFTGEASHFLMTLTSYVFL